MNIAGGFKVTEPAVDLALVMAMASSALDKPVPKGTVFIGEIGLSGELRPVNHMESRIREAMKMGFTQAVIPDANRDTLSEQGAMKIIACRACEGSVKDPGLIRINPVSQVIDFCRLAVNLMNRKR
ncbi:MAG: hypothetical protein M0C28_22545 [Candidatus Moduliflexus flocculans]|nr:hypothetical protein [Candidatus Moduliflexus flocculans]